MRSFLSRLACAARLGLPSLICACSSTIDGEGEVDRTHKFDIAVGAEVTLTFQRGACDSEAKSTQLSTNGCLTESPNALKGVSLGTNGTFTVLESKLERSNEIVVKVRAERAGDAVLYIDHKSFIGKDVREKYLLRSHTITDVDAQIICQWPDPPSRHYPVTQNAAFTVKLTAMDEATPLLSGALELIADRGGVELLDEPRQDGRRVRAPAAFGTYTWKVVGTKARPVTFDVYDPANVAVDVATSDQGVTVRPAINGVPACLYEGNARANVSVVQGACSLLLGDFEVEGALPVSFSNGGATLALAGNGSCTVEGSMKTGSTDRVTLDVKNVPKPIDPKSGQAIGSEMVEIGGKLNPIGECKRVTKVGNGKCEAINAAGFVLPDGDCFSDWDWLLEHYDGPGGAQGPIFKKPVGVGLVSDLHVSVEFTVLLVGVSTLSPNNLGFGAVPPPGLELTRNGCSGTKYESLGIRAKEPGLHKLGLVADNAPGPRVYDIDARTITSMTYLKEATDTRAVGTATTSKFFIGNSVALQPKYMGGAVLLGGIAPVKITGSDGAALATVSTDIFTGTKPSSITLASTVVPQTHVLDVVDASAITEIGGVGPQETTPRGVERCIEPLPKAAGQRIHGTAPVRGRIAFAGDACAAGGIVPWTTVVEQGKVCLIADGPAKSDVRVTWGSASGVWACSK